MFSQKLRSYKPIWFKVWELVSRAAWGKRGERALMGIDTRLLITIDTLREILTEIDPTKAALTCNDWMIGGNRQYSCLRLPSDQYYSEFSAHSRGQGIDLISSHYTADELREIIIKNRDRFPYLTRLEIEVSWVHLDVFNLPEDAPEGAIMLFTPSGEVSYI